MTRFVPSKAFNATPSARSRRSVSVAAATLLFEAVRQRRAAGVLPTQGEGLPGPLYAQRLFEWAYPQVAEWCRREGRPYPALSDEGEILESLPRTLKLRC